MNYYSKLPAHLYTGSRSRYRYSSKSRSVFGSKSRSESGSKSRSWTGSSIGSWFEYKYRSATGKNNC